MQNQIKMLDKRLDMQEKRLSKIEKLLWVCFGLGLNFLQNMSIFKDLFTNF